MKVGEIWRAKPHHPIRSEWDMIKLLRSLPKTDEWEVRYFLAEETPEEEREIYGDWYNDESSTLSREEILDQFFKVY